MFGIMEDGTFTLTAEGVSTVTADKGYVVATGAVASETELLPGDTFGRWTDTDTGTVYWDRVTRVPLLDRAIAIAKIFGELAIWDLGESKEIRITA